VRRERIRCRKNSALLENKTRRRGGERKGAEKKNRIGSSLPENIPLTKKSPKDYSEKKVREVQRKIKERCDDREIQD